MTNASTPFELHELGLGALLDRGIRIYRANFFKFVGILAVIQIPATLINLISQLLMTNVGLLTTSGNFNPGVMPEDFGQIFLVACVLIIVGTGSYLLISALGPIALIAAIRDAYVGKPSSAMDALGEIRKTGPQMILATFIIFMLLLVAIFLSTVVIIAGWIVGPGMITFFLMAISPLIAPILVFERKNGWDAIVRGWDMARNRFWWLVGFTIILTIFGIIVVSCPATLFSALTAALLPTASLSFEASNTIQLALQSIVQLILNLIYVPLSLTCYTLVYLDLRVRSEGLDLVLDTMDNAEPDQIIAQITESAPAASGSPLIRANEAGYFAILTVGIISVCAVVYGLIFFTLALPFGFLLGS